MTQEWKPQSGEMCAVKVLEYDSEDGFMICEGQTPDQVVYSVPIPALRPLPTTYPLTELERRVVEKAEKWNATLTHNLIGSVPACADLKFAVDAILSARALLAKIGEQP